MGFPTIPKASSSHRRGCPARESLPEGASREFQARGCIIPPPSRGDNRETVGYQSRQSFIRKVKKTTRHDCIGILALEHQVYECKL